MGNGNERVFTSYDVPNEALKELLEKGNRDTRLIKHMDYSALFEKI